MALARAVIAETQLLLLDGPLSALDPATRSNVRSELAKILRKLNLTTIIVTHDREEAFELADRIAILIDGKIQQHGTPEDVYERPSNALIAGFMGVNLLKVRLRSDCRAELTSFGLALLAAVLAPCSAPAAPANTSFWRVSLRFPSRRRRSPWPSALFADGTHPGRLGYHSTAPR